LAHDLINPLNSLDGFLRLLLDPASKEPLTRRQRRMLVSMDRASLHLLGMVRDVADLQRIETGQETSEWAPVDVRKIAMRVVEEYGALAGERGITLTLDIAPLEPLSGNARLLERFFDALMRSAGRRTSDGGKILLRLEERNGAVAGTLEHTGESPPEDLLEPLFSAKLSGPRPAEGYAALGLALCRGVCALHGGDIRAQPRDGGGTVFRFSFLRAPRAVPDRA
jgi:signal transduction histidine kinase